MSVRFYALTQFDLDINPFVPPLAQTATTDTPTRRISLSRATSGVETKVTMVAIDKAIRADTEATFEAVREDI